MDTTTMLISIAVLSALTGALTMLVTCVLPMYYKIMNMNKQPVIRIAPEDSNKEKK